MYCSKYKKKTERASLNNAKQSQKQEKWESVEKTWRREEEERAEQMIND